MPPAIFIDFDGTLAPCDVEFELFARFGGPDRAGDVVARWRRGEIDVPERLTIGLAESDACTPDCLYPPSAK